MSGRATRTRRSGGSPTGGPSAASEDKGDCFVIHLDALMIGVQVQAPPPIGTIRLDHTWRLCHGTVWHPTTGRHWHCWLEDASARFVIDISNGNRVITDHANYYRAGVVEAVRRYAPADVVLMSAMFNHSGPWHESETDR